MAAALYRQINSTVVPVSSAKVAEMVKLLENTFRAVNIGMVNELALMCRDLQVDVWEVIDAASTKPFGFMPFYPGPGLGGHCIPIDPFYLSWKARQAGFESRFIELAGHINGGMPRYVVERTADALNGVSKSLRGSRVHLFGIAYKADIDDVRESPALDVAKLLLEKGALVTYSDPYVPRIEEHGIALTAVPVDDALRRGLRLRGHHDQPQGVRLRPHRDRTRRSSSTPGTRSRHSRRRTSCGSSRTAGARGLGRGAGRLLVARRARGGTIRPSIMPGAAAEAPGGRETLASRRDTHAHVTIQTHPGPGGPRARRRVRRCTSPGAGPPRMPSTSWPCSPTRPGQNGRRTTRTPSPPRR